MRNLARGYTRKDLGVSYVKAREIFDWRLYSSFCIIFFHSHTFPVCLIGKTHCCLCCSFYQEKQLRVNMGITKLREKVKEHQEKVKAKTFEFLQIRYIFSNHILLIQVPKMAQPNMFKEACLKHIIVQTKISAQLLSSSSKFPATKQNNNRTLLSSMPIKSLMDMGECNVKQALRMRSCTHNLYVSIIHVYLQESRIFLIMY